MAFGGHSWGELGVMVPGSCTRAGGGRGPCRPTHTGAAHGAATPCQQLNTASMYV